MAGPTAFPWQQGPPRRALAVEVSSEQMNFGFSMARAQDQLPQYPRPHLSQPRRHHSALCEPALISNSLPMNTLGPTESLVISLSPRVCRANPGVLEVLAVDPDDGDNGVVEYRISPQNPYYTINSSTGKIRTSGVTLDRESSNPRNVMHMRTIVISSTDRGTPPLRASVSTTVFVNLLDLNDNDPTFVNLPFVAEVLEGLPRGSSVFKVQVEDPDEDNNGLVTMALQVGMPRLDFHLNTSTGVLTSTATLDREQIGQYYLRIIAHDAGKFPRTSTSTLTITGEEQACCPCHGWCREVNPNAEIRLRQEALLDENTLTKNKPNTNKEPTNWGRN
ncbi:Cadherin-23 [Merluccius polli]|uniref:Cadherin-23 n=1 Tax=Merluccius polli TaxID=89951 RepID=A0AA47M8B5_MERPO|nr:Cadherin-23 [Merluccius polli]